MSSEGYEYDLREYVWDRVWEGPAIIIGIDGDRFTLAEIVLPARKLGRVAHRYHSEICRYVHLLVPEDEAEAAEVVLGGLVKRPMDLLPDRFAGLCGRLVERLGRARGDRGILTKMVRPEHG